MGWRGLMPVCAGCGASRALITFGGFATRLGGQIPVTPDEGAAGWPGQAGEGLPDAGLPDAAAIAALGAEMALVHARLDHLQARFNQLEGGES